MFKIDGAYSNELSDIVKSLNKSSKRLQNFIIDSDTEGTVVQSLVDVSEIVSDIHFGLEDMQKKLKALICEIKSK